MSKHDDEVEGELVEGDLLPAIPEDHTPAVLPAAKDPDAWLPPEVQDDIAASIADSTNDAYRRDFREFVIWCQSVGRRPMPAAPETVSHYLSHLTREPRKKTGQPYGPATLDRIISSIRTTHSAAGYQPPVTKVARSMTDKAARSTDGRAGDVLFTCARC